MLLRYPGLRLSSTSSENLVLIGTLSFSADGPNAEHIDDEYSIRLLIPPSFPKGLPQVWETAGRIPSTFHRLSNGSLCLGSPTLLRLTLPDSASITSFLEHCIIPYLYSHSYYEKYSAYPFGELLHGQKGIRQDLALLYGVADNAVVFQFVRLTSIKRRIANKQLCPCGSSRRLGRCHHRHVNTLRDRLGRRWFAFVLQDLLTLL